MRISVIGTNVWPRAATRRGLRALRTLRRQAPILVLVAALGGDGCASGGAGASSEAPTTARHDANVISAEELATSRENDLYAAIQRLRPAFLSSRGVTSPGNAAPEAIQVYVDGTRAGDINALRQIRPEEVKEVRHLSAGEATQLYGTGNTMGAIVVKRK